MPDTFYVTTPIYYVNDVPHIGHAYTTVAADTMARYMRLTGREVFFLTGTDEHGQKVEKTAAARGMTNREFVDSVAPRFMELCKVLGVSNDDFIRTTEARHIKAVQSLFGLLQKKGYIEKGEYEDWYCVPCESFWTTLQLKDNRCPDCGREVEKLKEESYFFRLDKLEGRLLDHINAHTEFIKPKSRRNEILNFIKGGLRKLSISRTSFTWGIPVPGDERHVIYVWLDALTNYISALGYPDTGENYAKYWRKDADITHVIGKDILRFHAVYWPAFLLAADLPLPKTVFAHGWWMINGEKMSKSRGNVVDPFAVVEELDRYGIGVDGFRYFLLREIPFGLDGDYSREALVNRINSDLANDLGNLHFRTINMIEKYLGGEIPYNPNYDNIDAEWYQKEFPNVKLVGPPSQADLSAVAKYFGVWMNGMDFSMALQQVFGLVGFSNKLIDHFAPWSLAKSKSDKKDDKVLLKDVLGVSAQVLKASAVLLHPFMPTKTQVIWEQLGEEGRLGEKPIDINTHFFTYKPGQKIKKGDQPFPRIETAAIRAKKAASEAGVKPKVPKIIPPTPAPPPRRGEGGEGVPITIDDFMKVDLRVGRVLAAERVPKSDKLIKMSVDIGSETRQIVGGLGKAYSPEELVGRTVVVVANLKPAKLMGIESLGMVLAAGDVDTLKLTGFDGEAKPGTKVK